MASGDKIRVLIVDDIAETRENIKKLLQFESGFEAVGGARSGKEGIQLSQELDPDVVLMDINMPDMDGITATEMIRQKMPHVQVIILSVQGDQNYMRRAMLAGARDFLTKPPMGDELIAAVRRAGEMAHLERGKNVQSKALPGNVGSPVAAAMLPGAVHGKVITLYSPKGGTGCTTLAVNLAIALHNETTRVVLIDANLQYGDVAMFMNEQGKNTILDLAPRVDEMDLETIQGVVITHEASGVNVLAAPQRPEQAEQVSANQFIKLVDYLRRLYAYIVIDTASSLNDITMAAIDSSDVITLISTQEIPSIKNSRLFLDLLQTMGVDRSHIVFILNRFDKRITITPERIGENLKQEVAAVIPLDDRVVMQSVNRGIPFMLDNKTQLVARGIYAMAEAVRARLSVLDTGQESVDRH
ncbi:MAG: response regulator [Anaerolineales bacterium]|nr:response regulator [Anaerolineales bacterium]